MKRAVAREGRCVMDERRAGSESVQLEARLRLGVQHPRHAHYGLSRGEIGVLAASPCSPYESVMI